MARRPQPAPVPSATSLGAPPRDDFDSRVRGYLVSMGIRTLCFVAAFVTTGVVRWVCVALAAVLPYVAVVLANAVQRRRIDVLGSVAPTPVARRLGPGPGGGPG